MEPVADETEEIDEAQAGVESDDATEEHDAPQERESERKGFNPLKVLGFGVLVVLLVAGAWVAWVYVGTSFLATRAATEHTQALRDDWRAHPAEESDEPSLVADPELGSAQWLIRIPTLDLQHQWPVFVGTESLNDGVVWYPGTAQPGQVGNYVVSAYQVTHGAPFAGWEKLEAGDQVMVESRDAVFTYTLMTSAGELTVQETDEWIFDPVPGQPDAEPTQAFITLTTNEDFIPTPDRAVIFGVLTATEMK